MAPHSGFGSAGSSDDTVSDGEINYDVLERIGEGRRSTVFLATCNRGRLRHRRVVLKKVRRTKLSSIEVDQLVTSATLHQSLHHPNIVSLFSSFSTSTVYYQVLELCNNDTLSSFLRSRDPPTFSENELRGVLKSLIDALAYLRKEQVIHRDINPDNILLTNEYRIKLSGFGLAIRTSTACSTGLAFSGTPNYASPEILLKKSFNFPTDLWSLGCLALACLSGTVPFEDKEASKVLGNVSNAAYTVPERLSFETKNLISSLLQVDPNHRIPLHRISSHPFFNPAFSVVALGSAEQDKNKNGLVRKVSAAQSTIKLNPTPTSQSPATGPSMPKATLTRNRGRHSDVPLQLNKRKTFGEIGNKDLRRLLSDEVSNDAKIRCESGRRVVSDPTPRKRDTPVTNKLIISASSSYKDTTSLALLQIRRSPGDVISEKSQIPAKFPLATNPSISIRHDQIDTIPKRQTPSLSLPVPQPRFPTLHSPPKIDDHTSDLPLPPIDQVSIDTTPPFPFTTSSLIPQTQKTISGQVTILPSRSLLIDFREGERRKGKKGNEVLVVNPNGIEVKVFSAPHLSTPCCLAEASAAYPIEELPTAYWKSYTDAGRLIERLKQRTPKLVMFQDEAKCTLMSNAPTADIELMFSGSASASSRKRNENTKSGTDVRSQNIGPAMRIRLSRKTKTVEFSRYVSSRRGGEWTKKVVPVKEGNGVYGKALFDKVDLDDLVPLERNGVERLVVFLRVCEAVEMLPEFDNDLSCGPWTLQGKTGHSSPGADSPSPNRPATQDIANASKATSLSRPNGTARRGPLSTLNVLPRPRKLSAQSGEQKYQAIHDPPKSDMQQTAAADFSTPSSRWETGASNNAVRMRFMPSVGWCVHYGRGPKDDGKGGRYQIIFLDGVTLDVDMDMDTVELKNNSGDVTRCLIGQCSERRAVAERMKMFKECVSAFVESEVG